MHYNGTVRYKRDLCTKDTDGGGFHNPHRAPILQVPDEIQPDSGDSMLHKKSYQDLRPNGERVGYPLGLLLYVYPWGSNSTASTTGTLGLIVEGKAFKPPSHPISANRNRTLSIEVINAAGTAATSSRSFHLSRSSAYRSCAKGIPHPTSMNRLQQAIISRGLHTRACALPISYWEPSMNESIYETESIMRLPEIQEVRPRRSLKYYWVPK